MKKPVVNQLNWKQFVIACCKLNVKNTSKEIANVISENNGVVVSAGQVAAVKANFTLGRYGN